MPALTVPHRRLALSTRTAMPLRAAAALLVGALAHPAIAGEIEVEPLIDARLQLETLDVDSLPETSEALTFRIRTGAEATSGRWTARFEGQANIAIVDNYTDGLDGVTDRPIIADPENLAVYQAYLGYEAPGLAAKVGRQEISLDDERFIGTAPIRQNAQNFDAVRMVWTGLEGLRVDASYAWSFRPFWGRDGFGSRPESVGGDNLFINVAAETDIGTITGFAYIVDLDNENAQSFRLSSQTYGVRLDGKQQVAENLALSYLASFARQSDSGRNPNDYTADFLVVEANAHTGRWKLGTGLEILGADDGVAFASFQRPLNTGLKFLGLAGRFLPTPPDGLRDYYATADYAPGRVGALDEVTLKAGFHHFTSDRDLRVYGNEIDLLASARIAGTDLALRYADYRSSGFSADTQRFMVQLAWVY
ncbi:MAG: alginate export family protein [Erythrobacter sp.]|uniref:alginate export family protein n=1 Tax=Erythrobacter sp. TaxID=1042 RepID=UPI0032EE6437